MSPKTRLFTVLWLAGMVGVFSFQLVDLEALIALLPNPEGKALPFSIAVLRIINVVQTAIFVALAVWVGLVVAPRVGLSAPVAQALATKGDFLSALKPQVVPGLAGGVFGGVAVLLFYIPWKPHLPVDFLAKAEELGRMLPPVTRLLYGGLTEELLLRWGFMSLLVWLFWRLAQRGAGAPARGCFIAAIVLSSLAFGAGHLPIAFALAGSLTASIVLYVVGANSLFGFIAGWLYWKKGLESAILAHMAAHIVFIVALKLS